MNRKNLKKKNNKKVYGIVGISIVFIIIIAIGISQSGIFSKSAVASKDISGNGNKQTSTSEIKITKGETATGNLKILKSEVTKIAKFYPYKSGDTYMEVLAVKASDGTIRTSFNTCQVCYKSGKGYYKQEGNELVCQNCGNRFNIDQIEKMKNGCNPVPILDGDKTDNGSNIVIDQSYMSKNISYFSNWKNQ
jgi:uncharacterized membrane protein